MIYNKNERVYFDIVMFQDEYRAIDVDKDFTIQRGTLKELEQWLLYNAPNYRINNYEEYTKLKVSTK